MKRMQDQHRESSEREDMGMDSPVDKIRELHEHLQMLLETRALGALESNTDSNPASMSGATKGPVPEDASATMQRISTTLSALMTRDDQIRRELMKLQRTLSRQTFRGAESARRLVRKLARKAEQNSEEARATHQSLQPSSAIVEQQTPHPGASEISSSSSPSAAERQSPEPLNSIE